MDFISALSFWNRGSTKREIQRLGYEISEVDNGRVNFIGDAEAVALANIHLRTAERIMILVGDFEAQTFDELFEGVKAIHWEDFIPKDGKFWVTKASSVNSKLFLHLTSSLSQRRLWSRG